MPVQPIGAVSPSLINALLACPARVFLDAGDSGKGRGTSSPSMLGSAVHAALEELVLTGSIWNDDLRTTVRSSWVRALGVVAASTYVDVTALPGFFIKQARLEATARRLRILLSSATDVETELWLESADKTVRGRLDLAIHTPGGAWIVDYKSGVEREAATGRALVEPYERQLRAYAYLWREQFGVWPTRTFLLPLDGPEIEVAVDPAASLTLVETANRAKEAFNAALPTRPGATPTPAACRFCRHLAECPEFQATINIDWSESLIAVVGTVLAVEVSATGGWSILVDQVSGSAPVPQVAIARVDAAIHPQVATIKVGDLIAAAGLYPIGKVGTYGVRDSGTLVAERPARKV